MGWNSGISRRAIIVGGAAALAACGQSGPQGDSGGGRPIPQRWARTFTVEDRGGFKVVDFEAQMVSWGGAAQGEVQRRRIVLAPKSGATPALTGDLVGAALVRTPVERIAVNYAPQEAMLVALGAADRLVAVGGINSYDDDIRARTKRGELLQVGYGWHSAPSLDVLVASRPDVFFMAQVDPSHSTHLDRIQAMGVPVVPFFLSSEPHYMGQVEYIRLVGLLTGREAQAEAHIRMVTERVEALIKAAAARPRRTALNSWWMGGDKWMATARNAEAGLMRDANLEVVLGQPDDPRLDSSVRLGTERLLAEGRNAEFWIARDPHGQPYRNRTVLNQFRAFREGRIYAQDGRINHAADAYDLWQTGPIRPDLLLADYVKMANPDLVSEPFTFLQPDKKTGAA